MSSPKSDLEIANRLLNDSDAAGALWHTRRAQVALKQAETNSPVLLATLACRLIDCGSALKTLDLVREGLAILESNITLFSQKICRYSLQYNIGNAKHVIHDLETSNSDLHFNPSAISLLTEAKDHYWQALKLIEDQHADPNLIVNLANTLDQCYRVAEALRWYDQALLVAPDFPMAYLNRGDALISLNKISGSFTISQLAEARRSFRLAELAQLPPHLAEIARQRQLFISKRLVELGWPNSRIEEYDEQHQRECREHDPYWQFCLNNYLALNEHSLYCRCAGARRDDLAIPPSSAPVSGAFIPRLELLLNRLKSEFCLARALFYQATNREANWDLHAFEGTYSELHENEAVGLAPEFLRTSFRLCFGILDRIAKGLSELYALAAPGEALYFESFWRPEDQRRKGLETRWNKINAQKNFGLVALYSIATDLNRRNGQWGFFKDHRNHLEHGLLVVLAQGTSMPEISKPQAISLEQIPLVSFRTQVLHMLQLTASAIFSFTFCVREEGRRSLPIGPSIQLEMSKKNIGKE